MKRFVVGSLLGITALAALGVARADDWPGWRGPRRDAISREKGLLQAWPAGGPKLLWQVKGLGGGFSTPSVVGNRLFLVSNQGLDNEFVQALSVDDGRVLWKTRIGKVGKPNQQPSYPGARSTPTVDGKNVYALGSDGDLVCLEGETGKTIWTKNLPSAFGGESGIWAYAESPLVDGEALICTPGGKEATLIKLNKRTGAVIWKCAAPGADQACYASVITATIGGVKQYVQFLQRGVVGVEAQTGKFLWRYDKTAHVQMGGNIPTPVADGDAVYSAAGLTGGGLVRLKGGPSGFTTEPVYFAKRLPNGMGGSVKIGDYLYGSIGPSLACVAFATGTIQWQERAIGAASLCLADGRLYLHGENGDMALVAPDPTGYREQGRFSLPDQPDRGQNLAWTHPVVANGRLYVHDLGSLWCYDIKASR